jgi:hypothetical protein
MNYINYISSFLILVSVGYIYEKLNIKSIHASTTSDYDLVTKYLLNGNQNKDLPIIWIHLDNTKNNRNWSSFGSRSNNDINLPYLDLTIETIITQCKDDFNICLIDDNTFKTILPDWNIDISKIADPLKTKYRDLAIANILYKYGGIVLPPSFVCIKNLIYIYNTQQISNKLFVGELLNDTINPESLIYYPSNKFMISNKNCPILKKYIAYLEILVSTDFTYESEILNRTGYYLNMEIKKNNIEIIPASYLGVKDKRNSKISIEQLLDYPDIEIDDNCIGIYIDNAKLLKRQTLNWFCYLSTNEILELDNFISNKICNIVI